MRKKTAVLLALLLLLLPATALADAVDLLDNGDFSQGIQGWRYDAWYAGEVYTEFSFEEGDEVGPFLRLANLDYNDARLVQTVSIEKEATYRLSAMVNVLAGEAHLCFMDTFVSATVLPGGGWQRIEVYVQGERGQTSAQVAVRLGYYGNLVMGEAHFADVRLEKVDAAPAGVSVHSLRTNEPYKDPAVTPPDRAGLNALVFSALFALVGLMLYSAFARHKSAKSAPRASMTPWIAAIMGAALALRAYIAYTTPGYEVDMNCFGAWGERFVAVGPGSFYAPDYFCDYPPGYMPVLGLCALIARVLGLGYLSPGYQLVFKLPAILCDVLMCYFLFRVADKKLGKPQWGLLAALLYALCPAVLADSAAWGQVDSILALLMALSIYCMIDRRMMRASLIFTIGVLVKPQALMFGPVLMLAFAHEIYQDRKLGAARLAKCFLASAGLFAAVVLPFNGLNNPVWLLEKYFSTLASYPYATVNAMNFMKLFSLSGGSWIDQDAPFLLLTFKTWGTIAMVLSVLAGFFFYGRHALGGGDRRALPLAGALMLSGIFCFGVRMHERYLYPVLALVLLCFLLYRDRRFLWAFLGFAAGQAINILTVLAHTHILAEDSFLSLAGAALHIASTLYLFRVGAGICLGWDKAREDFAPFHPAREQVISVTQPDLARPGGRALRIERVDVILMAAVTLCYAALAFVNLGDTDAPQSAYRASGAGETLVFDLGQDRDIQRFMYYGEIPSGDLSVSFSQDGVAYGPALPISYRDNIMFKWHIEDVQERARYARVVLQTTALTFFEFAFTDGEGTPYPIAGVSRFGGREAWYQDAALLLDEQHLVPERTNYMNSMYFDEIYHARTAYEQIHDMSWYENTHPPLGKVFMSWCIELLGMTPFAWRLAGTLAGVLMLPGMYLMGKLLFKRRELAFAAMFLMAVDCMHFAQTRIATIDSFPVLFIIWAYFFMFLYANMSFYHERLARTLPPLFASGVFMGLACASKWIGFYAAAGLAVIFFYTLGKRYLEYRQARAAIASGKQDGHLAHVKDVFWGNAITTLIYCLLFFIAIPLAIYIASYYQYLMQTDLGNDLSGVWRYQTHMLDYHAGVFDPHAYSSTWYQWPVIWKPMAFFFDYRMPAGWTSAISTFGNPAVWWVGLAALVWTVVRTVRGDARRDPRLVLVLLGFAAQYLPWVLVPRTTYIYHYFASVPFLILCVCFWLEGLLARGKVRTIAAYLVAAGVLFALFYPLASGMAIPIDFARMMNWLPKWYLYWG